MALKVANRVKESTSTSGSGTITLGGASDGYQAFSSVLSNGDTTYYTVVDSNSWEVGIGTYNSNTLSRDTILSSSNSNNKINLAGVGSVFIAYPAEKSIYKDTGDQVIIGSSGIIFESGIPSNINNVLYNVGNSLYFNGLPLSASISGGYGIGVTNNSGNYTISSTLTTVNEAYRLVTPVFNRTNDPIPKFTVVYISGGQGDLPIIRPAIANGEVGSSKTFGITEDVIPAMDSGRVVSYGNIIGLNTNQYNPTAPHGDINGRVLYLSPSISGGLTLTKPYSPDHIVALGTVIRTHQNEGVFNVRVQNGFEIEELHNVNATGAISGQFISYDGSLWRNVNISTSDINDFNSAMSGLLPVKDLVAGTNVTINSISGIYTINASSGGGGGGVVINNPGDNRILTSTGSASGINAEINLSFNGSILGVSGLVSASSGNFINSLQLNGVDVSLSGHAHTTSNIVDFDSSVSGLLTPYALLSSGNFSTLFVTGTPVSISGHAHTASSITNFNSAVSGLLPSVSGSGFITVTFSDNVYRVGVTGLQPSGNYSLIGHTHIASDITDFNSAVSGLISIKNINGSGYVIVSSSGGIFTVGVTGLQPSGNYSLVGHSHIVSDITNFNSGVSGLLIPYALLNSGNFTNLFVNAVPVSTSGHTHLSSSITNFNSSVSGLLPAVSGSGFARVVLANNIYTVSITGLQPSGNYSVSGHQHIASDISNFNSSVSGLLSPYALLSSGNFTNLFVTGIPVSLSGHLHISNQITDFNSSVSGLLPVKDILAGTNVTISSANGIYTINAVSISGGGGGISITNPGDNRILTSTGSPSGANAESNLNFDGSILSVSGSINANSGNFLNTLQVNGTGVSLVGHTHISSNITDFNSAVSGLIPVKNIVSSGYVVVSSSGGIFTVGVTGLQPTGNYSLVGHTHSSSDITNFNSSVSGLLPSVSGSGYATVGFLNNIYTISITGLQPSGNYSVVGHTHIASNITDFNSAVSGLLPVKNIGGSGYVSVTSNAGNYTVSVTGLQPSGNYSVVGHTHLASDITNFNSATSGLLIPYALLSSGNFSSLYVNGTAVSVSGHTHTSSQIADFNSSVSGLINVKNITGSGYVSVTSSAGNFTIGVTGLQPSGNYSLAGHTHTASNITDFNSSVSGLLSPYALLSSGNFTNLFVNGTRVSISGHTHTSTDITNFNSSVSGLLPSISGSGYAVVALNNNIYTISTSGLQPSGNYSVSGHTHLASDITNFNSAVTGLLNSGVIINITGGSGNFNSLFINGVAVSTSGGGGGGGGGVSISDYGTNRVLLSDGTPSGIIAQSGLTFDGNSLFINGVNSRNGQNLYMWANFR